MQTQTDIENERRWVGIATLSLLIVYSLVTVAYGYSTLLEIVVEKGWPFAHLIAIFVIFLCLLPGVVLWKLLRPHSKYAAIYGLLVAAICSAIPHLLV